MNDTQTEQQPQVQSEIERLLGNMKPTAIYQLPGQRQAWLVRDLIAVLQEFDAELPVLVDAPYHGHLRVHGVKAEPSDLQAKRRGITRGQRALVLQLD